MYALEKKIDEHRILGCSFLHKSIQIVYRDVFLFKHILFVYFLKTEFGMYFHVEIFERNIFGYILISFDIFWVRMWTNFYKMINLECLILEMLLMRVVFLIDIQIGKLLSGKTKFSLTSLTFENAQFLFTLT